MTPRRSGRVDKFDKCLVGKSHTEEDLSPKVSSPSTVKFIVKEEKGF